MNWEKMNAEQRATVEKLIEAQPTMAAKKRFAESIGFEWSAPTVKEQIGGKGKIVHDFKRGRAIHGRTMALIPPVTLPSGREVPQVAIEPECVRAVAFELIRLADSMGW